MLLQDHTEIRGAATEEVVADVEGEEEMEPQDRTDSATTVASLDTLPQNAGQSTFKSKSKRDQITGFSFKYTPFFFECHQI